MNTILRKPYGLILAGGHSRRMGQDKAMLRYHGRPQIERAFQLLSCFCSRVFVSARSEQMSMPEYKGKDLIEDLSEFQGIGPLGGILSAMTLYSKEAWLVLACDLPFITPQTLETLLASRNHKAPATAYISSSDGLPEPMCSIWEPFSKGRIIGLLQQGIKCPRKVLIQAQAHLLIQENPHWLDNVNTPQEYEAALVRINK